MIPQDNKIALLHEATLFNGLVPAFRYDGAEDVAAWQQRAYDRLWDLLGLSRITPAAEELFEITEEFDVPGGHVQAFRFQSEPGYFVPGYILLPADWQGETLRGCICLQGHSTGMHNSLAMNPDHTPKCKKDMKEIVANDRDFAVRAVKEGYAAICIEQRYMGTVGIQDGAPGCSAGQSMATLLLGRTPIGERVWDVMRLIDAIEKHIGYISTDGLICMGNSGGGTATFYAACIERRIRYAMPSCAFCTYQDSIVDIHHCACNYIPGIAPDFDMGDLAGLIAPRNLVIVNGVEDTIFPDHGVRKAYAVAERMFAALGGKLALVTGSGGHRLYADPAWEALHGFEKENGIR